MRHLKLLAWLLAAHAAALALFTSGFFLTRFEVADVSSCATKPDSTDLRAPSPPHLRRSTPNEANASSDGCWMPRRYARVVFVVVDALRYDFVASTDTHKSAGHTFFTNQLPVLQDAVTRQPQNAVLLKFVADPPTMTMQRLKGLTTGSLPTFLDIKDNMASSAITEDNLLRQMRAQQRGVVFMGDDTWEGLYASELTRAYAFDSFNVKDLDSVDRGVARHLFPELQRRDWGLLIAHVLGVDHVGHTHGPSSVFMTKKLQETNTLLEQLLTHVDTMDDDTLLAVMGDHGMSADGNHGGASDDETGAALFLYSRKPLVGGRDSDSTLVWPTEVPQVDLVPTLALLSGLPIPFGNLGSVIPQLFFMAANDNDDDRESDSRRRVAAFRNLNDALALNVEQVRRYLLRYSRASKLPERAFDTLEHIYRDIVQLRTQLLATPDGDSHSDTDEATLATLQQAFLREALALGRSIWTQFDLCTMGWGGFFLLWLLWFVAFGGILTSPPSSNTGDDALEDHVPLVSTAIGAFVGTFFPVLGALVPLLPTAATSRALVVALVCGLSDVTVRLRRPWPTTDAFVAAVKHIDASTVVAAVVVLLRLLALLSNSYIVAEDQVTTFLAVTTGVFLLVRTQRSVKRSHQPDMLSPVSSTLTTVSCLVLIASTRLASALEPPHIIQSDVSLLRTLLPLAATVALAVTTTRVCTGINPVAPTASLRVRTQFAALVVSCTSCAVYWCLSPSASSLVRLWLPRTVLLTALSALSVELRAAASRSPTQLNTVVSSEYVLTAFLVVPAYMVVLGPTSPLPVLLLVLQALSFAAVAVLSGAQATVAQSLLWSAVSGHAFFFTGHQNTFPALQNAAAFVGFDTFDLYRAGALLGLNTFGSYFVWLLFLPLALARPTTVAGHCDATSLVVTHTCWRHAAFTVALFFALLASVSTAFVALQRRHLMVWAIFAPKFLFDATALLVVELLLLLVTALL